MKWGIENEEHARQEYTALMRETHEAFNIKLTGLHINPAYPHLGASPDGVVSCKCVGRACLK